MIILAAYPGPPSTPKIVSAFKDCINLAWSAPANTGGTNLLGYNVEKRKNGSNLWAQVNPPDEPIRGRTVMHGEILVSSYLLKCNNYFSDVHIL